MTASLRQFFASGLLLNDRGEPIRSTPLLEDMLTAFEGDFSTRVFVSPRRAGKSTAVALLAAFELLMTPNAFTLWVSGSGDQAKDILEQKVRRPLLRRGVKVQDARDRLVNPELGSVVECVAPAEVSAPGRTVSLLICDEARSVPEEVYEVLRPSAAGGKIFVIGSPGPPRGWFHRAATEPGPRDFVRSYSSATMNPALPAEFVAEERERLGKRGSWGELLYRREHQGSWVEFSEPPLVSPGDVRRASRENVERFDPESDSSFIGVDLSTHRDATSAAVLARRSDGSMRVVEVFVVDPRATGRAVDLELVEKKLLVLARRYRPRVIAVDRFQAAAMCQRLRAAGLPVADVAVTASLNQEIFTSLAEALAEGRLSWKKDERLEAELLNLELAENVAGGFTVRDRCRRYHRDLAFSLALAVREAERMGHFKSEARYEPPSSKRLMVPDPIPWEEQARRAAARELRQAEEEYHECLRKVFR
jgi:hypothetical protein